MLLLASTVENIHYSFLVVIVHKSQIYNLSIYKNVLTLSSLRLILFQHVNIRNKYMYKHVMKT